MPDTPNTFAFALERAAAVAAKESAEVIEQSALNIKNDWVQAWSGLRAAPHIPKSISYDVHITPFYTQAEIGPDKDRRGKQGALGNLLEFGSVNNAPIPAGGPALAKEAPNLERALAEAVDKFL